MYQSSLLPKRMINGPGRRTNLNSYYPGANNIREVTTSPNIPLPFDGDANLTYLLGQGESYRSPSLLGVVGNSPEQVAYYQRGLPEYIPNFYPNIPLTDPQSKYISERGSLYANLYEPDIPIFFPQTVFR
jgi:hypothetical protein